MGNNVVSIIIIVFCVIMSAYFSATETAFSSLNRIRIKNMAEKGNKKAALVMRLSKDYDRLLSSILIGNNIVNIASTSIATILFVSLLGEEAGASVSTVAMTVIVLIFGEVSPKSIAKENPEAFAMLSAPILSFFITILKPFNFFFIQWKKLLSLVFKAKSDALITDEELLTIVEEAEQEGGIDEDEGTLIRSAIEFNDLRAGDIFTPRIDIIAVEKGVDSDDDVEEAFTENGFSRLPVFEESIDNIVGIIHEKDFHKLVYGKAGTLDDIIKPAIYITKSKKAGSLLKEMQREKMHMAVIIDEFGGTVGIVTMEDILEEIVGEIWDEHDKVTTDISQISDTEYVVSGGADIEDVLETFGIDREMEIVSVNGWVMEQLRKIPEAGDQFTYENLEVTVLKVNGKRVDTLRIVCTKPLVNTLKEA